MVLGDVAVGHPAARIGDVEQDVDRLARLDEHGVLPDEVLLRSTVSGEDDEAWVALNNRIFAGHPENGNWTLEDLQARTSQPWFRADDLLMLEVDGGLAGSCWLKVQTKGDEGMVGGQGTGVNI